MTYPKLYKKASSGSILTWKVTAIGNKVIVDYGGLDSNNIQTTEDIIHGKNIGKANETTDCEQAILKAKQLWDKKIKSGYVESIDCKTELPSINPMLAKVYGDHKDKVTFPCIVMSKLDGCFTGSTLIKTNLGDLRIDNIVNNKIECEVLSFNEITGTFEYKPIVNWFNNGKDKSSNFIKIYTGKNKYTTCTKNHKIFTDNGWKRADELSENEDKILKHKLSDRQIALITGTLLGDSCFAIEKRSGLSYRLLMSHKSEDLVKHKAEILNIEHSISERTSGYGTKMIVYSSCAITNLGFPLEEFYSLDKDDSYGRRKLISYETLMKYLTLESLVWWFTDDASISYNNGNKETPRLYIHTQGYDKEQVYIFQNVLKDKFNINTTTNKDKKVKDGGGLFIVLSTKDTLYFCDKIKNIHLKGSEYKFFFKTEGYQKDCESNFEFCTFKTEFNKTKYRKLDKYDIEVKDNHNYIADGFLAHNCRAISVITEDTVKLYSRTRKEFKNLNHIKKSLREFYNVNRLSGEVILDGEIYSHEFKDDFNAIVSRVKRDEEHPEANLLEYHIYDIPSSKLNGIGRMHLLGQLFAKIKCPSLEIIRHDLAIDHSDINYKLEVFLSLGYEGLMVKLDTPYEFKRSFSLLKDKPWQDDEFKITGIKEGNGRLIGHVGSFDCVTKEGKTFNCKMKGSTSILKEMFNDVDNLIGKMLTVKFFQYTVDGVPRFPVGIAIRDYE